MDASFENGLRSIFQSSTEYTAQIGEYILSSGGKRLRPKLVLLIGKSIGLDAGAVMPLAYTVELMHTASLLHDDVVDSTEMRRSKPTANQVFGDNPPCWQATSSLHRPWRPYAVWEAWTS
jgi:octaprenyl-diphosphate synthase